MKDQTSNARISAIPIFSRVVRENHKKVVSFDIQLNALNKESGRASGDDVNAAIEQKIGLLQEKLSRSSAIVIIFSAIAVEAYIYDYAARHLTDDFVQDHIDKLDTVSKWVIIPKLVTGRELPRRQHWFGLLKKLIKARNSITHYKSSEPSARSVPRLQEYAEFIVETARQSIHLLDVLADKIAEIDPEETPWVKSYLT